MAPVWPPKTGVLIMEDLFTEESLYKDIPDVLYLFTHCVLKTSNEAVVEGHGNIGDQHAAPGRHLSTSTTRHNPLCPIPQPCLRVCVLGPINKHC